MGATVLRRSPYGTERDVSELLTPRQVAERLSVSPRTVYLWIEQGRLPVIRFSERVTRVPAEAVDALVAAAYVPPSRPLPRLAQPLLAAEESGGYSAVASAEQPVAPTVAQGPTGTVEAARAPRLVPTHQLRELLRTHREEILAVAGRRRVENIRVFGSVARGDASAASDIDLLVDLAPHASLLDLSGFAGEVEELLGVRVDVVPERNMDAESRERVLREALPL